MENYIEINPILFENNKYKSLSNDARVLYAFLERKNRLNKTNDVHDKDGKTFVIYPRKDLCQKMHLSENIVAKCMRQLRELELIREKKQGRGLPNKIYILPLQE